MVVGAQRPASGLSTDAFLNLLNAVRVAGAPEARGMGVLTVLNDEIHAAREVTKTHSARAQTFKAPDFGVLGHADEDRIAIYRRPVRVHAPAAARELGLPDRFPARRDRLFLRRLGRRGAARHGRSRRGGHRHGGACPRQPDAGRA